MSNSKTIIKTLSTLGLLCIFILTLSGASSAAEPPPIFYVDARGKSGTEIGIELGNLIKVEFPNIEQKLEGVLLCHLSEFGPSLAEEPVVQRIDQKYIDEVNALGSCLDLSGSDTFGDGYLSLNELWALQLIAEIGRESSFPVSGC